MKDADQIALDMAKDWLSPANVVEARAKTVATALRSAYSAGREVGKSEGYAAAREQAVGAVEKVKRIYIDASNANSAGPLLDEAIASIPAMEPPKTPDLP